MLLKEIELKNFRQYKGIQKIAFSTDTEKNVTLFLGKNTSGKTTFIQAFRWVLYNDCNFTGKKSDKKQVLNSDVRLEMRKDEEEEARVTLKFENEGNQYELFRSYIYRSRISGSADLVDEKDMMYYYDINGEKKVQKDYLKKISEMLPASLAEYFFFDGEKIATIRDSKNVKDSINTIMGLVPLEHMRNHLTSSGASYSVDRMYRESMKDDAGVSRINQSISIAEKNLKEAEDNYNTAKQRFEMLDRNVQESYSEMSKLESIAEDARRLKKTDYDIEITKTEIDKAELDLIAAFAPALSEVLSQIISAEILSEMKDLKYDDKGIPDMTATAVNFILDRGVCICGADLKNNEKCRQELLELLSYLPPESIGTQIRHLDNELKHKTIESSRQKLFDSLCSSYDRFLQRMDELEADKGNLEIKIGSCKDADTLQANYKQMVSQRDHFQQDMVRYNTEQEKCKTKINEEKRRLDAAAKSDDYNRAILDKISYVHALAERAQNQYSSDAETIFNEVQETLVEVFNSMYHGKRTIHLTNDYHVTLNVGGEVLDNSKGLDTIQNFAFIATLLKVAKSRRSMELSAGSYPLVMDAVFSNTDEIHIRNICNELPKLSEQAVLAIMDKDWAIASSTLESRVGKKYRIVKESESYSHIEEVN